MTEQTVQYKGYTAIIEYSPEDGSYVGEVAGIEHTILFEGKTIEEISNNFKDMIDNYPAACTRQGLEPCLPPAEIMVPIPTEHFAIAKSRAEQKGVPIQEFLSHAIQQLNV